MKEETRKFLEKAERALRAAEALDAKYHRWLLDAFDDRLRGDYDFEGTFDSESVSSRLEQVRQFLQEARRLLS